MTFYQRANALALDKNALLEGPFLNFRFYISSYISSESLRKSLSNDTHIEYLKLILLTLTGRQKSQTPALWRRKRGLRYLSTRDLEMKYDY